MYRHEVQRPDLLIPFTYLLLVLDTALVGCQVQEYSVLTQGPAPLGTLYLGILDP